MFGAYQFPFAAYFKMAVSRPGPPQDFSVACSLSEGLLAPWPSPGPCHHTSHATGVDGCADAWERAQVGAMAERGKVCGLRASKPDQEAVGRDSGERNPITGVARKKMCKVSHALDTGERMLLQWAVFRAWSGLGTIQMGNPGY